MRIPTETEEEALEDVLRGSIKWSAGRRIGTCLGSGTIIVRHRLCDTTSVTVYRREELADRVRDALLSGKYNDWWLDGCIAALKELAPK